MGRASMRKGDKRTLAEKKGAGAMQMFDAQ
jgi:hypothetical protein